jgi:GNAT superfamily N-acetyltransferase
MDLTIVTLAQRPDLRSHFSRLNQLAWPTFMRHDPVANQYWSSLFSLFPEFQLLVCTQEDQVLASGNTIPIVWNETLDDLPAGWDAVLAQGVQQYSQHPTTLSALAVTVDPVYQGQGLSRIVIEAMRAIAVTHQLNDLIAPVRPTMKSRYPLTPIERYVLWLQDEGMPFDPWLRVHVRFGAVFMKIAPQSMVIPGTINEWEQWTAMCFPESGLYIVPSALEPVEISYERNQGIYREPNVWMRHRLRGSLSKGDSA